MPPALTPSLAVEYVHELSADVRAVLVLGGDGALLAGPAELADAARALLTAAGDTAEVEDGSAEGVVCAVRTDAHAAVAVCGRFAIGGVVRQDLRAALAALEGRPAAAGPGTAPLAPEPASTASDEAVQRASERLISALQRHSSA
jgi:hypothetical protein